MARAGYSSRENRAAPLVVTVVVMMGRSNLEEFCRRLIAAGRGCECIAAASNPA